MAKKKSKNKKGAHQKDGEISPAPKETKAPKIVQQWEEYFQEGKLEDWRRLMRDLGFDGEFNSKKQCRKALKKVWVNIKDFLAAVRAKQTPYLHRFQNERELAAYTKETGKVYPRKLVVKGSPLTMLLAYIWNPAERYKKGGDIVSLLRGTHI